MAREKDPARDISVRLCYPSFGRDSSIYLSVMQHFDRTLNRPKPEFLPARDVLHHGELRLWLFALRTQIHDLAGFGVAWGSAASRKASSECTVPTTFLHVLNLPKEGEGATGGLCWVSVGSSPAVSGQHGVDRSDANSGGKLLSHAVHLPA